MRKKKFFRICVLQTWMKIQDAEWVPRTYLELEALPCILILTGTEPLGESLPRLQLHPDKNHTTFIEAVVLHFNLHNV